MTTSPLEYIRDNVWVSVVIGVGGASILIVVFILVCCCCWYCCRRRRRNRFEYRSLIRSSPMDDSDCISYGSLADSMEMRREEKTELEQEDKNKPSKETDSKPSTNERKMATKAAAAGDQSIQVEGVQTQAAGGGRRELGLYEAMEQRRRSKETSDRESALLACQFHIRNDHRYALLKTLPDLGSRMRKYWFLVDPIGAQSSPSHLLLTISPVSKQCPIRLQGASLQTLNELLAALKHPFLQPLREIDLIRDKSSVIVVQPFIEKGSLKDLIYKSQPVADWSVKYSVRRKGLPVEMVALYGRQILEVLVVLYRRGFPPLGHVHSGNVFVDDKICRLSGYENTLLGYKTRLYKILKEHLAAIDVIMFGHLLFEMSCGYELVTLAPTQTDCQAMQCQPVIEIIEFIFSNETGNFPTIQEVLGLPFFQRVKVPQLQSWDPEQLQLTTEMKVLLRAVRKGRPAAPAPAAPQPKPRKKTGGAKQKYPVTPLRPPAAGQVSGQVATQPAHAKFSAPPPPTGPPPPTKSAPPRKSKDRGALLSDIRRGTKLRETVTDDRSAPRI